MYTKDQLRQFGDWLASRKDVVTGSQIDEYIAGIETGGSADVVERIYQIINTREFDEDMDSVARTNALTGLIEAEVERRVRERENANRQ